MRNEAAEFNMSSIIDTPFIAWYIVADFKASKDEMATNT